MNIIKGGTFHLSGGRTIKNGMLVHENGKITYCGKIKKISKNADIIELDDSMHVTAGLIDCHSHIGLGEEKVEAAGNDTNETSSPITAEVRAIDGINPFDPAFKYARASGVTTLNVVPGSANPIGGLGVTIKSYGTYVDKMAILSPSSIKMAFGQNPKNVHGAQNKCPKTRMGTAALMRQALYDAIDYAAKKKKDKNTKTDLKMESLHMLLSKKIKARIHCHRTDDIMTAIRIAEEFKFDFILDHVTEGHIIPEIFKGKYVVVGPTLTARYKDEVKNRNFCTPGVLHKHGAHVAITTDHTVVPIHQLMTLVMLAVKAGFPKKNALSMVTEMPAKVLGLEKQLGKLSKGFDADIVIWSDDPLLMSTKVLKTFVNGEQVYEHGKHPSPYSA